MNVSEIYLGAKDYKTEQVIMFFNTNMSQVVIIGMMVAIEQNYGIHYLMDTLVL